MKYKKVKEAIFRKRPNRFIAHVILEGKEEVVHVKNTGRLKEILLEGSKVILEESDNPNRKTKYSLIAASFFTFLILFAYTTLGGDYSE